jgi:DNA polymerase-3 subunit beta
MKLTITHADLLAVVSKGGSVAPKSSPSPILNHVRLVASEGFLAVASSDLDRFAESKAVAEVEEQGSTTVNAAALSALVARLPRDKGVSLEIEGGHLIVKAGRSRSKLATLPAEDFPEWVDPQIGQTVFTLKGADFAEHFGRVRPFTEPNGFTKPMLQGVSIAASGDKMTFLAMDMIMAGRTALDVDTAFDEVIVPNEAIDAATRMFKTEEEVTVAVSRNVVTFSNYAHRLGSKLIEGQFPDVQKALEFETTGSATVSRPDLVAAVERAVLGAAKEGQWECIILKPGENSIEVKGANTDGNEVRDEVEAAFGSEGPFRALAFSPRRLAAILNALPDDEIEIRQNANNCIFVATGAPEFSSLISPLRSNVATAA